MLHVACCMLHAARCMLHAARCMLHAACCMLHVARRMLHVACCTSHVACHMLHVTCCVSYAAGAAGKDGKPRFIYILLRLRDVSAGTCFSSDASARAPSAPTSLAPTSLPAQAHASAVARLVLAGPRLAPRAAPPPRRIRSARPLPVPTPSRHSASCISRGWGRRRRRTSGQGR